MKTNRPVTALLCTLVIAISPASLNAENSTNSPSAPKPSTPSGRKPGEVVVVTLEGTATATDAVTGKQRKLAIGDRLLQGTQISTRGKSKVGLGFENGTFIEVAPDTKFVIQEFLQAPWDMAGQDLEKMESEPSNSNTTLFLNAGQVLADIKKLKAGSEMQIVTPLATAGIRGTTGQITHTVNSDGSPQRTNVNVPNGAMAVTPAGGGEPVIATGSQTAIVSTGRGPDGQSTAMQTTTGTSDPQTSAAIMQSAQTLQTNGMQAFIQGMAAAAQSPQAAGQNLSPDQRQQLQEASETGDAALVETVSTLSQETPTSVVEIAQFAASLAPGIADQIAVAAATVVPASAVPIAVGVSVIVPQSAANIAAAVATTVPQSAAQVAGAVAAVAPSQAAAIASSTSAAVPDAAVQIAQSVAQAQPQQSQQIAQAIIEVVPQGDAAAIQQGAQTGAQLGTIGIGTTNNRPTDAGTGIGAGSNIIPVISPR